MHNYVELFLNQLSELPPSGYKTQLSKYGETIVKNIIGGSIIGLIANIEITTETPKFKLHESDLNIKTNKIVPVRIKLPSDLEVLNELVYKQLPRLEKIQEATNKVILNINFHLMNCLLSDISVSVPLSKELIFNKKSYSRIIIVGNDVLALDYHIQPITDNTDLKFIGNTKEGDLLYHSCRIPSRSVYTIDLKENKPIRYSIKDSLTVYNNEYIHVAGVEIVNPDLIRRYTIS